MPTTYFQSNQQSILTEKKQNIKRKVESYNVPRLPRSKLVVLVRFYKRRRRRYDKITDKVMASLASGRLMTSLV